MKNRPTFIILVIFFIAYLIGGLLYLFGNPMGWLIYDIGLIPGVILGLVLLIKNGTIISTLYFKLILAFMMLTFIGALFKVSHWPFGPAILGVSLLSIGLIYSVRFINKKDKTLLDILKLLWVVVSSVLAALIGLGSIPSIYAQIGPVLFWTTMFHYALIDNNSAIPE